MRSHASRAYDYKLGGGRLGGMYLLSPKTQIEAGVGLEQRRYQGSDALFLKRRQDTFYDAYVGLTYAINRKISLRPHYKYYKNHANTPLYGYKRHVFTVNMRYEFF